MSYTAPKGSALTRAHSSRVGGQFPFSVHSPAGARMCSSALVSGVLVLVLCFGVTGTAQASKGGAGMVKPLSIQETFRLQVAGRVAPGTTFWVAYGPLRGRFVILRLRRDAPGSYVATQMLPMGGRTTFAYVAGRGTMMTRLGLVPGNPVITIKEVGPVTISHAELPAVQWQAPVG